jgi:glycerol-3-phosphate dehydrogenase
MSYSTLTIDSRKSAGNRFDVIIIGGGIHGAALAYECSRAGMHTALLEMNDFASATSANSLKILHGGIRYLQHGNFKRMRESIRSRREIMTLAPHLVSPLPCIVPTCGGGLKGKHLFRIALKIYDWISYDRNQGLRPQNHLPTGKILSQEQCRRIIPHAKVDNLTGAMLWYDGLANNTERLVLEYLLQAQEAGALIRNYAQVSKILIENKRVTGVEAVDRLTGEKFITEARMIINAAGPWLNKLLGKTQSRSTKKSRLARALNIVINKSLFQDFAVGLEGSSAYHDKDAVITRGKRSYFFVPWRGYTMIGTSYKPYAGDPDTFHIELSDIEELVQEVNIIYPHADLSIEDVTFYHAGLIPRTSSTNQVSGDVQLDKHTLITNHASTDNIRGLLSIKGVKYTTAPNTAKLVLKSIQKILGKPSSPAAIKNKKDKHNNDAAIAPDQIYRNHASVTQDLQLHLQQTYGRRSYKIVDILRQHPELDERLNDTPLLLAAEVVYFIREEMARKLTDVIFRRTNLGTAESPPAILLNRVAGFMAQELSWDDERTLQEKKEVMARYHPLQPTEKIH